jgi:hypothetical protein
MKRKTQDNAGLEILQDRSEYVEVKGGEKIEVKPFTFGQLLKALKHLASIGNSLSLDNLTDSVVIQALAIHTEDVLALLMLATGKDKAFFDTLDSESGIDIALAAWRVNQDFFVQKLAPKIQQLSESSSLPEEKTQEPEQKAGSASSKI